MTEAVNLENLHEMTGNDPELEKELFSVFLVSAEKCLDALRISTGVGAEETWRTQAHALKGMSLNLGAEELGKLCAQGQTGKDANESEKKALLQQIEEAYAGVKAFLEPLLS